jgi:hypothetical protein
MSLVFFTGSPKLHGEGALVVLAKRSPPRVPNISLRSFDVLSKAVSHDAAEKSMLPVCMYCPISNSTCRAPCSI